MALSFFELYLSRRGCCGGSGRENVMRTQNGLWRIIIIFDDNQFRRRRRTIFRRHFQLFRNLFLSKFFKFYLDMECDLKMDFNFLDFVYDSFGIRILNWILWDFKVVRQEFCLNYLEGILEFRGFVPGLQIPRVIRRKSLISCHTDSRFAKVQENKKHSCATLVKASRQPKSC